MHVLVVSRPTGSRRGYGVERYTDELCNALKMAGVNVVFIGDWRVVSWLAERVPSYGPRLSALLYDIIMPVLFVTAKLARTSRVIHFVDVANTFPSIVLARIMNAKTVVSVQSLNGISYIMADPMGLSVAERLYVIYRAISMKLVERFASSIIALSTLEAEEIRRICGDSDVRVVPPSCSLPDGNTRHPSGERLVLGCVGALVPSKRMERAITTLAMLKATGVKCRLLIAGEGYAANRLRQHVARVGVGPNVDFIGHVGYGMEKFYSKIDFLVFPSLRESFGHPVVEAARCGVPCVSFADSVLPTEIRQLTQVVQDEREAARRILSLWHAPEQYAKVARDASIKAREFSADRVSRLLLESYSTGT